MIELPSYLSVLIHIRAPLITVILGVIIQAKIRVQCGSWNLQANIKRKHLKMNALYFKDQFRNYFQ